MAKENISATLDRGLLGQLDNLAKTTERNRSWILSQALEVYFEELEDVRIARERLNDIRLSPAQLRKEIGL